MQNAYSREYELRIVEKIYAWNWTVIIDPL